MFTIRRACYIVLCLSTVIENSIQKSTPESPTYIAAVVEYSPQLYKLENGGSRLSKNADQYVRLIEKAANKSADIVVFPEIGLSELKSGTRESSVIPDPKEKANPCTNPSTGVHEAVRQLSCAAQKYNIYVVVNIPEKKCDGNCSSPLFYNCDIAFDRQGRIVARYRKFNLFGEPGFSTTAKPDISVFETDFGVKFGMITCFDIMFEKPAVSLVEELGVADIIFPTAWFSELPFLSAVQEQVAWAHTMDVNFLGSGYNAPEIGSTGSGIYAGKQGILASLMATTPTTEMLVATVPKKTAQIRDLQSNSYVKIIDATGSNSGLHTSQDNLEPYTTLPLTDENSAKNTHRLCNGELCCQFEVQMRKSDKNGYKYRLAVFDGVRSFTYRTGGLQVCAIVFCANDSLSSCGLVMDNPEAFSTTFEYISISGDFHLYNQTLVPNTLLKEYNPMSKSSFSFVVQEQPEVNTATVKMETKTSQSSLLTFGIYGRDYLKDGLPTNQGATSLYSVAFSVILLCVIGSLINREFMLY